MALTQQTSIDTTAPFVTSVTTPPDGVYRAGEQLTFVVHFSEPVIVAADAGLHLYNSLHSGWAAYAGGSNTSDVSFVYTVSGPYEPIWLQAIDIGGSLADASGNPVPGTLPVQPHMRILFDCTAPPIEISGLAFSADTGSSASDFVTQTAGQTITATLSAHLGPVDRLLSSLDGGAHWVDVSSAAHLTSVVWSNASLLHSGTVLMKVVSDYGYVSELASQAYTVDTTAPRPPSPPDLAGASDDGSSNSDNVTSLTSLTITGTAEAGSLVTLHDTNGTSLGATTATGGAWTITTGMLDVGSHTVTAAATDLAGNTSAASHGLTFVIEPPGQVHTGTPGDDALTGGGGADILDGGGGADTLAGGPGDDAYVIDRGDTVRENPGEGTDTVTATSSYTLGSNLENLVLVGRATSGAGNALANVITGNERANHITGLGGADTLTGGFGADRFIYTSIEQSPGAGWDVITDFGTGRDVIDVRRVDANSALGGVQRFAFIGTAAFSTTDATGQLRFDATAHMLYGSVNTDPTAEFAIELPGVTVLGAHDLVL